MENEYSLDHCLEYLDAFIRKSYHNGNHTEEVNIKTIEMMGVIKHNLLYKPSYNVDTCRTDNEAMKSLSKAMKELAGPAIKTNEKIPNTTKGIKFPDKVIAYYPPGSISPMSVCNDLYNKDLAHQEYQIVSGKIKPHVPRLEDIEDDYQSFWKDLVETDDVMDPEKVKAELYDFHFMMHEVPKVYCHITGNLLSKTMYYASTVIAQADDYAQEEYYINLNHDLEHLEDEIKCLVESITDRHSLTKVKEDAQDLLEIVQELRKEGAK